uniref:Uncharacterized protein n=1 Tax=Piliocolobus tephrosceles TaxID=591936 RepID=A0A8C9HQB8_9PRIM
MLATAPAAHGNSKCLPNQTAPHEVRAPHPPPAQRPTLFPSFIPEGPHQQRQKLMFHACPCFQSLTFQSLLPSSWLHRHLYLATALLFGPQATRPLTAWPLALPALPSPSAVPRSAQHYSVCSPGPAALASPGSFLERQTRGLYCRPLESESSGWGPAVCVLTGSPGDAGACSCLRTAALIDCSSKGKPCGTGEKVPSLSLTVQSTWQWLCRSSQLQQGQCTPIRSEGPRSGQARPGGRAWDPQMSAPDPLDLNKANTCADSVERRV